MSSERCDLLVVGGGTAGIVAAKTAARFGVRVVLIERDRTGGDCLWTGCVPSKALIAAADAAARARGADRLGVRVSGVAPDLAAVMDHVRTAVATISPVDSPEALRGAGVEVRHGTVRLLSDRLAEVDGAPLAFDQAVLATGAAPTVPPVPGLAEVVPLTSDDVWDLTSAPGRLAVLGGGSIGCELGQAMARLGVEVALVEGADRLLPREDPAASAAVQRALVADGVRVHLDARVERVERVEPDDPAMGRSGVLRLRDGGEVPFDRILVAVGRTPRTAGLGLAEAGVEVDDRGFVVVDDRLRTTNPRIWAAGDLTGHPQFTHVAGVHGSLAASNAVLGVRRRVDTAVVPRVTYTQPEVASVGVDTATAADGIRTVTWSHHHVDRAVAESDTDGLTSLALDPKGRIVGATVVGPRAGETLGELALAVREGLRTRDLAGLTHAYPTWNDGAWNAAIADVRDQLARPATARALAALARVRRRWMARGA